MLLKHSANRLDNSRVENPYLNHLRHSIFFAIHRTGQKSLNVHQIYIFVPAICLYPLTNIRIDTKCYFLLQHRWPVRTPCDKISERIFLITCQKLIKRSEYEEIGIEPPPIPRIFQLFDRHPHLYRVMCPTKLFLPAFAVTYVSPRIPPTQHEAMRFATIIVVYSTTQMTPSTHSTPQSQNSRFRRLSVHPQQKHIYS